MTRILLIEDNDISRAFLAEALSGPDIAVTACDGFTDALQFCGRNRFDLIVSDIRLGDGSLYEMTPQLPAGVPIVATSADINANVRDRLGALGISSLLAKPTTVAEARAAVERALDEAVYAAELPVWDEERAFKALGRNSAALTSLKSLFKIELPEMAGKIQNAFDSGNSDEIQAILHKLKASCGFLGASRLLEACNALDEQPDSRQLASFLESVTETLAILEAQAGSTRG